MNFTSKEKLPIIQIEQEVEWVTFAQLEEVLWEKPSNVIYIELSGILYGIVSRGDIERDQALGEKRVRINRKFTSIYPSNYMEARRIFKDILTIHNIPVVDENGSLLGEYIRWDDELNATDTRWFDNNKYASAFWKENSRVAFVRPCNLFQRKQKLFVDYITLLREHGVLVEVIDRKQVGEYIEKVNLILFTDRMELSGTAILYIDILGQDLPWGKATTLGFCKSYAILDTIGNSVLQTLQDAGIKVISFDFEENDNGYLKKFTSLIYEKYKKLGLKKTGELYPEMKKEFLEEIYDKEYEQMFMPFSFSVELNKGLPIIADMYEPKCNVKGGKRQTINQPEYYGRCIYLYGPCMMVGVYAEDKHTIASWLQHIVNCAGFTCKVVNMGVCNSSDLAEIDKISKTPLKKGDIVIFYKRWSGLKSIPNINMTDVYESNHVPVTWVVDEVRHCNYKINKMCAEAMYDKIVSYLQEPVNDSNLVITDKHYIEYGYLDRCFLNFNPNMYGVIGSIVMNCNPFTFGHRYLIEQALKEVDFLIIFVVEEDRSLFSFDERFAMVCAGTEDLEHVLVVPSGNYILSKITFPEYFTKETDQDIRKNVENDITFFAEEICPRLNISYRFAGEEREDVVTQEYNMAMKRILPQYGVKFVEIARMTHGGALLSATRVREALQNGDEDVLKELVPESTLNLLYIQND